MNFAMACGETTFDDSPAITAVDDLSADSPPRLPARLRLLAVSRQEPSWVRLTLQLDAEGCHEPVFSWVSTVGEALTLLRDESFDCILIGQPGLKVSQRDAANSDEINAMTMLHGMRGCGCDDPAVLVTPAWPDESWALAERLDCRVLVSPNGMESAALVPFIRRIVIEAQTIRENRSLAVTNHRRQARERSEAFNLLGEQRAIVAADRPHQFAEYRDEIAGYYRSLLRSHVIMGAGTLEHETAEFATVLAAAEIGPRDALAIHLQEVEHLICGLGNRASRQVMSRADLLALQVIVHLGEQYQTTGRG